MEMIQFYMIQFEGSRCCPLNDLTYVEGDLNLFGINLWLLNDLTYVERGGLNLFVINLFHIRCLF